MWIRNAQVLALTGTGWEATAQDLEVEQGKVVRVQDATARPMLGDGDLDAGGMLAVPGLVNLHHHSNDAFFRGRHERMPLEIYMLHAGLPWGLDVEPTERMLEVRSQLGAAEMLLTGTTAVLDDCYPAGEFSLEQLDAVARGFERAGIRARVAVDLSDLPMARTVRGLDGFLGPDLAVQMPAATTSIAVDLGFAREWAHHRRGQLVAGTVAVSGPQRATDDLVVGVASLAEELGLPWTTHAVETRAQAITARSRYGESLVAHCARLGVLGQLAVLAHGIWLDEGDAEVLARTGATVVHNPTSNLRLGSGIARVAALRRTGVNVALGTDGAASNDSQNLLLEMRLAASLQSVVEPDWDDWLSADDVLAMATSAGARAFAAGGGAIEVGAPADLVLFQTASLAFTPLGTWTANLVLAEYGRGVHTVIVDGEIVVSDGELTGLDLPRLLEEAHELATEFFESNQKAFDRIPEFRAGVDRAIRDLYAADDREGGDET